MYNCSQNENFRQFNYGKYNNITEIIEVSQTADLVKIGDWYQNPNKTVVSKLNTNPIIYFRNGIELSCTHNIGMQQIIGKTNLSEWVRTTHI